MKLRDYQEVSVTSALSLHRKGHDTAGVMGTGGGKTVVFSFVIKGVEGRALVLGHTNELVSQAVRTISEITGEIVSVEMNTEYSDEMSMFSSKTVVATHQSMNAMHKGSPRYERFDPKGFSIIIVDETHRVVATNYLNIIDYFKLHNPDITVFGVTATPKRGDGVGLHNVLSKVAFNYPMKYLIDSGWAVPIVSRAYRLSNLDYSWARTNKDSYNTADAKKVFDNEDLIIEIAASVHKIAKGRKSVVFCQSVEEAEGVATRLNNIEPGSAFCVHGKSNKEERKKDLALYAEGKYQFFCNVGVAVEGWDDAATEVIFLACLIKSVSPFGQRVGRGVRLPKELQRDDNFANGDAAYRKARIAGSSKPHCEVVEFRGECGLNKIASCVDILGGDGLKDDVIAKAMEIIEEAEAAVDVKTAVELAIEILAKEEMQQVEIDKANSEWKLNATIEFTYEALDIFDETQGSVTTGMTPPSREEQALAKAGFDYTKMTPDQIKEVAHTVRERAKADLSTMKQLHFLKKFGINAANMPFMTAMDYTSRIQANEFNPVPIEKEWRHI